MRKIESARGIYKLITNLSIIHLTQSMTTLFSTLEDETPARHGLFIYVPDYALEEIADNEFECAETDTRCERAIPVRVEWGRSIDIEFNCKEVIRAYDHKRRDAADAFVLYLGLNSASDGGYLHQYVIVDQFIAYFEIDEKIETFATMWHDMRSWSVLFGQNYIYIPDYGVRIQNDGAWSGDLSIQRALDMYLDMANTFRGASYFPFTLLRKWSNDMSAYDMFQWKVDTLEEACRCGFTCDPRVLEYLDEAEPYCITCDIGQSGYDRS